MPNQKVLVIDDERIVIDSVTKILKEERIDVEATLSGRQGLEMALKKDYDLVLTDMVRRILAIHARGMPLAFRS